MIRQSSKWSTGKSSNEFRESVGSATVSGSRQLGWFKSRARKQIRTYFEYTYIVAIPVAPQVQQWSRQVVDTTARGRGSPNNNETQ